MEKEQHLAPFLLKPTRINNYTHLITLLKIKQQKNAKYPSKEFIHKFSDVLSTHRDTFNVDDIVDGFLHNKLKERFESYTADFYKNFDASIDLKIKEIKKDNDQKIYMAKIGDIKEVEMHLFNKPSIHSFKDELLYDIYCYLNKKQKPMEFLENSYFKYVEKFTNENKEKMHFKENKGNHSPLSVKQMVSEFVKLKFNREEYNIEIYEGRALWAEIFVLYRIGRLDIVKEVLTECEIFFEFMSQKFKSMFLGFISGKTPNFVFTINSNEDKFKKFLFNLIEEKAKSDGLIIATVEDYLWLKMVTNKDMKNEHEHFDNPKVKFMICLLCKKFKRSIDILLKSDFGTVAKFFLLKELCLEQALDATDNSSAFTSSFTRRQVVEDSSSVSLESVSSEKGLSTINPVFFNFMFNIVQKLSSQENKVKFIEMLKIHPEYYKIVPNYIIKYDLFDIIGKTAENQVEFCLDSSIAKSVLEKLRAVGNKSKLIQLYKLIDSATMITLLIEVLEESIIVDEIVDTSIVEAFCLDTSNRNVEKLKRLYSFYKFNQCPTISNLNFTVLFDKNVDLREYRHIVEKVFFKAVDVVKAQNDKEKAKTLFNHCGMLDLSEECSSKVSKDLVMLI